MRTSVIISVYKRPFYLELVLRGYARQSERPFEIVVADDGSQEDVAHVIARVARETGLRMLHVWHADEGFRKTIILNRAIVAARGDYLLFTDGDCVPRSDFVETHNRLARPDCYLSGGCLRLPKELSENLRVEDVESGRITNLKWLRRHGWKPGRRALRLAAPRRMGALLDRLTPTRPDFQGNNASVWRDMVLAVNGFDNDMAYGSLDRALGFRLVNAGYKGVQVRYRAITMHLYHGKPYRDKTIVAENYQRIMALRRGTQNRAPDGISQLAPDPALKITEFPDATGARATPR